MEIININSMRRGVNLIIDENNPKDIDEEVKEEVSEEVLEETEQVEDTQEVQEDNTIEIDKDELAMLRKKKDELTKAINERDALKERLVRLTAEYENYRKRTTKEKDEIYTNACYDILKEVLPVADNLERAIAAEGSYEDLKKGIEMTVKGLNSAFEKLGVEEIDATGEFDPNLHQAVMHVEDENFDKNQIAEVFMKGYKRGDKVIRYTVVKVAN